MSRNTHHHDPCPGIFLHENTQSKDKLQIIEYMIWMGSDLLIFFNTKDSNFKLINLIFFLNFFF